jgi:ATP diphosphatase
MTGIERLHEIMTRLRDPLNGCPWDREQTLESLKPCVLEETYELLSAMDRPEDVSNHIEELGDVLLQVMFQSVMAEQERKFTFDDVANAIADKLVHRHPHVFGDVKADDPATVLRNWEQIKQREHAKESRHSARDGVPPTLPALLKARRTMEKAKRIGYEEEMKPVAVEGDPGEFLLRVVKSIAAQGVDSEAALEKATAAFAARFRAFEEGKREQGTGNG